MGKAKSLVRVHSQFGLHIELQYFYWHRPNCLDTVEYLKMYCHSVPNFNTQEVDIISVCEAISMQHAFCAKM